MPNTRSGEPTTLTDYLTTAQVARLLRRSIRTVHRMVDADRLHAERVPGYKGPFLFDPDEVERVRRELNGGSSPPLSEAQAS